MDTASFAHDRAYSQVVRRLFEAWAQKENKPRCGFIQVYGPTNIFTAARHGEPALARTFK